MPDIYKRYNQLEQENYKLEQNIYYLEEELRDVCKLVKNYEPLDNVQKKMDEQFGEEE